MDTQTWDLAEFLKGVQELNSDEQRSAFESLECFNRPERRGLFFKVNDQVLKDLGLRHPVVRLAVLDAVRKGDLIDATQSTIKMRAPHSAMYGAFLLSPDLANPGHSVKEAAVVVHPHMLATFAHGTHSMGEFAEGCTVQVFVHSPVTARMEQTTATVLSRDAVMDVLLLGVDKELAAPVLDATIIVGERYYLLGQSTQAQAGGTSVSHGMVAATELDARAHLRGDMVCGVGDSGGGCFAVDSGKLLGMAVGSDAIGHKAILVPSTSLQAKVAAAAGSVYTI